MKNEELLEQILLELKQLNNNFKQLFNSAQSFKKPIQKRTPKPKLQPLTEDEVKSYQSSFLNLFQKWIAGHETEVSKELDKYSPEEIRRLGDANNLNVTSKMSKEKVLHLISMRFREKKLLTQNMNATRPFKDQIDQSNNPTNQKKET